LKSGQNRVFKNHSLHEEAQTLLTESPFTERKIAVIGSPQELISKYGGSKTLIIKGGTKESCRNQQKHPHEDEW
jgi:hypothetical protein